MHSKKWIDRAFTRKHIFGCALQVWGAVLLFGLRVASGQPAMQFKEIDFQGSFGFFLDGLIINAADGTSTPVTAIGLLVADGEGNFLEAARTMNFGGQILRQVTEGTYRVDFDGTGTAELKVSILGEDGKAVPASLETLSFVITSQGDIIQGIVTGIWGPKGEELPADPVISVVARKQVNFWPDDHTEIQPRPMTEDEMRAVLRMDDIDTNDVSDEDLDHLQQLERELLESLLETGMPMEEIEGVLDALVPGRRERR